MGETAMWKTRRFLSQSLRTKLMFPVILTMAVSLCVNLVLFGRVNTTVENMDQVYGTNIRLGDLERLLTEMESSVYQYLNIQSQEALEAFTDSRVTFEEMILDIDDTITDHPARRLERNIRNLALSYLELTDQAIQAKQAHDVAAYKENFGEIQEIYRYLLDYINGLDTLRFKANSEKYSTLYQYLLYLEVFITAVLIGVTVCLMALLYVIIGNFTRPLEQLAQKAKEVGKGNFEVALDAPKSEDEVGTVTVAFNQMITSINEYIRKTRESLELEMEMKEKELSMENLLRDAQLKYFEAQINPHFLFNTLNAGLQLAMMEDAERTYAFIENMAFFFRYRLRKNGQNSTLSEEIELLDSYMYIMNVRFSNEIYLEKEVDSRLLDMLLPGMVLQPLIENALSHGLSGVDWEKRIHFSASQENGRAVIRIRDNGVGIPKKILEKLNTGEFDQSDCKSSSGNGVGLMNVRERLRLYFDETDVMTVESGGEGMGTEITIWVPVLRQEPERQEAERKEHDKG
ncbi:MAG: sensor histidine kinase [Lachnospiraceae bacterium]